MTDLVHINPDTLPTNPAFSQAVLVGAGTRLLFIGGQNGVDASGRAVADDAFSQAAQALRNVEAAVAAAGGTLGDIVKWAIIVTDRSFVGPGFRAFQEVWGGRPNPPAITVQIVAGLARPELLVEVDAVAALPPGT